MPISGYTAFDEPVFHHKKTQDVQKIKGIEE